MRRMKMKCTALCAAGSIERRRPYLGIYIVCQQGVRRRIHTTVTILPEKLHIGQTSHWQSDKLYVTYYVLQIFPYSFLLFMVSTCSSVKAYTRLASYTIDKGQSCYVSKSYYKYIS